MPLKMCRLEFFMVYCTVYRQQMELYSVLFDLGLGKQRLYFFFSSILFSGRMCYCVVRFFRLEKMGALDVDKVVHRHQAWRLISCIWLHAGVFHLLANMLSLVFIGILLEQEFGFSMHPLSYFLLCC